jgi:hypothetical protein
MSETQMGSLEKKLEAKSSKLSKESDTPAKTPPAATSDAASEEAEDASDDQSETNDSPKGDESKSIVNTSIAPTTNPLVIDKPYPPTMYGVESVRMQCRFMMNRIVTEVGLSLDTHSGRFILITMLSRSIRLPITRRLRLMSLDPCLT